MRWLRRKSKGTIADSYKGISANCLKHPFTVRCSCNRCIGCIESETGILMGSVTYADEPNSGLLMCNQCLSERSDEEIAEFYAMFSTKYWSKPVSKETVLATLDKRPSYSVIRRYRENGQRVTEICDTLTGSVTKSWTRRIDK